MTMTLEAEARRNVTLFTAGDFGGILPRLTYKRGSSGKQVLTVTGMPVFRSGTFRDSMGLQHTWESIHMDQMVQHFDLLRARKILADIPVRDGHPGFLMSGTPGTGKVVGWHNGLRVEQRTSPVDGGTYDYLLADYDILDEDAQQAIEKGLWRNRSAEVGTYITNAEAEFWPVYFGVAYVDIGAVEGLNGFSHPDIGKKFSLMFEKETPVTQPVGDKHEEQPPAAPPVTPPAPPVVTEPVPAAEEEEPPVPPTPAPVVPPATPEPAAAHSAPHQFSVNGAQVSDYASVQRHIDTLETFRKETLENGRKNFVTGLAAGPRPKIVASQIEQLEKFALTLSEEQWQTWVSSWDAAPSQSLLANHGGGATNPDGSSKNSDELEILEETVRQHKLSGMPQEQIEKTPSWKKLQTLKSNKS